MGFLNLPLSGGADISLESKLYVTQRFISISSGTSGNLTKPSGSTILLNTFGAGADCIITGEASSLPNYEHARASDNTIITGTLDTAGAWTISSAPAGYNICLVYEVVQSFLDFDSSSPDIIHVKTLDSGLEFFLENRNTSAPNATVPVHSLTPIGAEANIDVAISPKGTGAMTLSVADSAASGGDKRGSNAIDLQTSRTTAAQVASGTQSVGIGARNTASGSNSTAIGYNNTASSSSSYAMGTSNNAGGTNAVAIGSSNSSTGNTSTAIGNSNTTSGNYAIALGFQAVTGSIQGRMTHSSGQLGAAADSQGSTWDLKTSTTNATATQLTSGGIAAGTASRVLLPNNTAYAFKGVIIGKQSGSANCAAWEITGLIVRGANAASTAIVGTPTITAIDNTAAFGTPTLAADTTNGCLTVSVVGVAATNIRWTCTLRTTEVAYA